MTYVHLVDDVPAIVGCEDVDEDVLVRKLRLVKNLERMAPTVNDRLKLHYSKMPKLKICKRGFSNYLLINTGHPGLFFIIFVFFKQKL